MIGLSLMIQRWAQPNRYVRRGTPLQGWSTPPSRRCDCDGCISYHARIDQITSHWGAR